jgi:DNA-binding MurR/RpiR family transcriptional regulator
MKFTQGNPSMAQRIANALPKLTRAHRKIADYVQTHPLQVATLPIDELATTLDISVATANRFARAIGFPGYPQFRAALVLGFENTLAPVEKLRDKLERPATTVDIFKSSLANIQRNIELTQQGLDARLCEQTVDAIVAAKKIRIIGYGASSWLGGLLQRGLDAHCNDVLLLSSVEGPSLAGRMVSRLQPTDLLIVISFPRYSADAVFLAQSAQEAGVPVLALTDRVTSPLAPFSTMALYAHTESPYFSNCEASVLALIEALRNAVAHRAQEPVKAAAQLAESVLPWIHGDHGNSRRQAATTTNKPGKKPSSPKQKPGNRK